MVNFRKATLGDMDILIKLRLDFLHDMGTIAAGEEEAIRDQYAAYLTKHLNRDAVAILAEVDGEVVAIALLAVGEQPAHHYLPTGRIGTLLNVYTYPGHRRQGLAEKITAMIIEEARNMGVSAIDLLATPEGKPLYEKLGFREPALPAMRLRMS